jgi:hypothetical protein
LVPSATFLARSTPSEVRTVTPSASLARPVAGVRSAMRTPIRSQAAASPQASLAGWTIAAPSLSHLPAR